MEVSTKPGAIQLSVADIFSDHKAGLQRNASSRQGDTSTGVSVITTDDRARTYTFDAIGALEYPFTPTRKVGTRS